MEPEEEVAPSGMQPTRSGVYSAMAATVLKSDVEAMWQATTSAPDNADMAAAVAAMNVLAEWIKKSTATTMMELQIQLKTAAEHIESFAPDVIALSGGCELFMRYVTRSNTEIPDFEECKAALVARSAHYKEMTLKSRNRIAALGETFIRDGCVVLLHGYSRVAQRVLQAAKEGGKRYPNATQPTVSRPFCAVFPPFLCTVRLPGAETERTGEKWRKMGEIWGRNGRETAVAE